MCIERKRRMLPAIYNAARVVEQPIPSIEPVESDEEMTNENVDSIASEQNTSGQEESLETLFSEIVDDSTSVAASESDGEATNEDVGSVDVSSEQITISQEENVEQNVLEENNNSLREDIKPTVDEEDLAAFDNLFGDDRQSPTQAPNDNDSIASSGNLDIEPSTASLNGENYSSSVLQESFLRSIRIESTRIVVENVDEDQPNSVNNQNDITRVDEAKDDELDTTRSRNNEATAEDDDGSHIDQEERIKEKIAANLREVLLRGQRVVFDDDLEYISIPDQQLQAIQNKPTYRTKANDQLCGNQPFKESVSENISCVLYVVLFLIIHLHCTG